MDNFPASPFFEPPGFLFFDAVKAAVWVLVAVATVLATRGLLGLRPARGSIGAWSG